MQKYGFVEGIQEDFCHELGIPFEKDDSAGSSDALGNRAFTAWTAVIGEYYPKLKDLQACLDELYKVSPQYGEIIDLWLKFKGKTGFLDYNDFLIEVYESDISIDAKIGFFDEVQDFNRLEFEILKEIISGLERVYLAGDDDQAIYGWKGAKPDFFLDLKGEEIVLKKTFRLPSEIWQFAQGIITQVERRKPKEITPINDKGVVQILPKVRLKELVLQAVRASIKFPNWKVYLLLRTNHMVYYAQSILLELAIPFKRLKGASIWDKELAMAWNIIAKLRNNIKLDTNEIEFLIRYAHPSVIPEEQKETALKALENGNLPLDFFDILKRIPAENLFKLRRKESRKLIKKAWKPLDRKKINLYVDTIHASKGKEADIVFLADAITSTIDSAIRNGLRDAELRVFYVGVTRARRAVFVAPLVEFGSFLTREVVVNVSSL